MQTEQQLQPSDYAKEIATLVAELSLERAAQVYDFVRFLQVQPALSPPTPLTDEGWLDDSEAQMQSEDSRWETTQVRHRDEISALITAARAEINADTTQPMFTEDGEILLS